MNPDAAVTTPDVIDLLARLLRGDAVPSTAFNEVPRESFLAAASEHGVLPLVAQALTREPGVPAEFEAAIAAHAREHVVADICAEAELRRVLEGLHGAGLQPLLMKGAHLAYSHYPRPDLRPRLDTDLMIAAEVVPRAHRVLERLGYTLAQSVGEHMVMSQRAYTKPGQGAMRHVLDVHWRLANPRVFANLVAYEELSAGAVPLPALGPSARGLSPVHALFVACVHRVAHHLDVESLIWLYDIHLLASRFDERAWQQFVELAASRQVTTICRTGLERAIRRLATPVPEPVLGALALRDLSEREVTAGYLVPHRSRAAALLDDLNVLPTWTERWRLIREHVLPEASYMRDVYAPESGAPLPVLYVRRVVRGARKWLRRR